VRHALATHHVWPDIEIASKIDKYIPAEAKPATMSKFESQMAVLI